MGEHEAQPEVWCEEVSHLLFSCGVCGILRLDGQDWMVCILKRDHFERSECRGTLLFLLTDLLGNWRHTEN